MIFTLKASDHWSIDVSVGDLESCKKVKKHFKRQYKEDTNLFLPDTRPDSLARLYSAAESDVEGVSDPAETRYLCIPMKRDVTCKYLNVETETKRVSVNRQDSVNLSVKIFELWTQVLSDSVSFLLKIFNFSDFEGVQFSNERTELQTENDKISISNICKYILMLKIFCISEKLFLG